MQYYSLNNPQQKVGFAEAVIQGIAPDKGLYFPETIPTLSSNFWDTLDQYSNTEIAYTLLAPFVGDAIPEKDLKAILEDTLSFDFPVVAITENIASLELFHGPTMAFKDVGARFMARCLGYFNQNNPNKVTVLVATSGDTGGAVANGFLGTEGVDVVILYPSGKVSDIQEKQLTTLGQNISALEVDGVFDDCQDMVKQAFLDKEITDSMQLTSANSINVARWLPQLLYYVFAYKTQKDKAEEIIFSVPSGNYGNICAAMVAQKLGMPVQHFIAANNANNVVARYLKSEKYEPKTTIPTISNAMDVGNPSNFVRIQELYHNNFTKIQEVLSSYSYDDAATRKAMDTLIEQYDYIADPHGAIGFLAAQEHQQKHPKAQYIFLETAHPIKFLDVLSEEVSATIAMPAQIASLLDREKVAKKIASYEELKRYLLGK